jgi:beta-lactamase class A
VSGSDVATSLPASVTWSVLVRRSGDEAPLLEVDADRVCATASIGKVLLLITVAEHLETSALAGDQVLSRKNVPAVADSGLWQHLAVDSLPVTDVCALVGATSDNLATNVLIDVVGLEAVAATARRLGLAKTALHDVVREHRGPEHPAALSTGTAAELVQLLTMLDTARNISPMAAQRVRQWLSTNNDLSMVASAFGLDPLAHSAEDRGFTLWNKTGTNDGVRCDAGVVHQASESVTYAVLANWSPQGPSDPVRDEVLAAMNRIGQLVRDALAATPHRFTR